MSLTFEPDRPRNRFLLQQRQPNRDVRCCQSNCLRRKHDKNPAAAAVKTVCHRVRVGWKVCLPVSFPDCSFRRSGKTRRLTWAPWSRAPITALSRSHRATATSPPISPATRTGAIDLDTGHAALSRFKLTASKHICPGSPRQAGSDAGAVFRFRPARRCLMSLSRKHGCTVPSPPVNRSTGVAPGTQLFKWRDQTEFLRYKACQQQEIRSGLQCPDFALR